jgi:2,3-bisphosphoglycerate-dependent phosphoglycerate mutase
MSLTSPGRQNALVMHLILVRHAQPIREHNPEGPADPGLSELGHWQAQRLCDWLALEPIDHIVTSPKRRAIETVGAIIEATGAEHLIVEGLDEIDRMSNTYFPTELLATEGGEYWDAILRRDWEAIGWDPPDVFHGRVVEAWETLLDQRPGERVLVACHGGVVRRIVSHLLAVPGHPRIEIDYASITRVELDAKGVPTLVSLNETGHFDAHRDKITPHQSGR